MGPIVWKITKPGLFLYYLNVTANHFVRILVLIFSVKRPPRVHKVKAHSDYAQSGVLYPLRNLQLTCISTEKVNFLSLRKMHLFLAHCSIKHSQSEWLLKYHTYLLQLKKQKVRNIFVLHSRWAEALKLATRAEVPSLENGQAREDQEQSELGNAISRNGLTYLA